MPDLEGLPDEELFANYKATGDDAYFAIIYNRRVNRVRRYLERLMPSHTNSVHNSYVEDLVQQVFIDLVGHEKFKTETLLNFLLERAKLLCWDLIRYLTSTLRSGELPDVRVSENDKVTCVTPHDELSGKETTTILNGLIESLPETERRVVRAMLDTDNNKKQSAHNLGMTPRRFLTQYDRALRHIRKMAPQGLRLVVTEIRPTTYKQLVRRRNYNFLT